ncbi:glycosyltransferase [Domibacillus sp.]|uniref:glycosyltransferase n=1 Tax=Domibacillus sp. TaxID=1969783 RepID=UPI0028121291|nr:glycosyltransferase [Domibacillus sp.]
MKKDILISVYDMEIGGIERSLINMLESFDYEKYNVDLLIFHHKGDFLTLIPEKVNVLNEINAYSVFRKPIIHCVKEGHYLTSAIRIISKFAANIKANSRKLEEGSGYIQMQLALKYSCYFLPKLKKQYDIAISYAWPHDILLKRIKAGKKIAWIHTDYSKLEIDNKVDLNIWTKFDYIVSISEECTKAFLSVYPSLEKKILLVENLTSPAFIKKMAGNGQQTARTEVDITDFNLLSVGRLSYVKGFDMAVKALKILHDKGLTNIKWYIIGEGGYKAELEELIRKSNMEKSFILLGKKTNPYPYFKICDLYVQPSRYEGKAVAVTEAKILEKPIVITNYPTAHSQIQDGREGVICELSEKGLAQAIELFFKNNKLKDNLVQNIQNQDYDNKSELNKLYEVIR